MVKVAAYPQARLKGVIQPPRLFELEGPATVVAAGGVVVSSVTIFDPIKGYPPRDGLEFGATVYSKVEILVDGKEWIEGRVAATSEPDDLIFFMPASAADGARLPALPARVDAPVAVFDEYFDITRAPAAFERCAIARVSTVAGIVSSGRYIFVSSLSVGSPVVDTEGRMVGLGVRVASAGLPATAVLLTAPRVLEVVKEKGLLTAAPAP
jgi:hypothetical protein